MHNNIGIYKLEFIDKTYYIGQSLNLKSRLKDHYRMLLDGNHHSYKVQNAYIRTGTLPIHSIIQYCEVSELDAIETKYIKLDDPLCLNIKGGGDSNHGINAPTAKYLTSDIETAFFILVDNPGVKHSYVADFVGIDINTVHDISAGRGRVYTELSKIYPEKYSKLLSIKAHNTRGKNTVVLRYVDGTEVTLVTGQYMDFCRKYGVQSSNLSKVINGSRKATMGWSLVETYENIQ